MSNRCYICKIELPLDRVLQCCQPCKSAYDKQYKSGRKDTIRVRSHNYYLDHRDHILKMNLDWKNANRESHRLYCRNWNKENPESRLQSKHRRRALEKDAFVERVDKLAVWVRDGGICQIGKSERCWYWLPANPKKWHLDHIIPISKSGAHSYSNTQASCPPCNFEKNRF